MLARSVFVANFTFFSFELNNLPENLLNSVVEIINFITCFKFQVSKCVIYLIKRNRFYMQITLNRLVLPIKAIV